MMVGSTCAWLISGVIVGSALPSDAGPAGDIQEAILAGYLIMPTERVETTYADGRKGRLVFLQLIMPDGTLAWVRESKLVAE